MERANHRKSPPALLVSTHLLTGCKTRRYGERLLEGVSDLTIRSLQSFGKMSRYPCPGAEAFPPWKTFLQASRRGGWRLLFGF
jgi:hypothetical protein